MFGDGKRISPGRLIWVLLVLWFIFYAFEKAEEQRTLPSTPSRPIGQVFSPER